MRRFVPHIVMALIGLLGLAVIWYFEAPVQSISTTGKEIPSDTHLEYLDFYIKVLSDKPLKAGEIEIALNWDATLLELPTAQGTMYARLVSDRPEAAAGRYLMTIIPKSDPPENRPINTPPDATPLVRLGFKRVEATATLSESIFTIEATALTANGERVPMDGVTVKTFEPPTQWRVPTPPSSPTNSEEDRI